MKLRLPHKLQAALIATLASVALTTLSSGAAYAEVGATTLTTTFSNAAQTNIANVGLTNTFADPTASGKTVTGAVTSLTQSNGTNINVQTGGSAGTDSTYFTPATANVGSGNSWTAVFTYNNADDIVSIDSLSLTYGLYNSGGNTHTGSGWTGDLIFTATVADGAGNTAIYQGKYTNPTGNPAKQPVTLTLQEGQTALDLTNSNSFTVSLTPTKTWGNTGTFVGIYDLGFNVQAELATVLDYTWKGTPGQNDWSNAVWDNGESPTSVFTPNGNAVFDADGYDQVSITTAVSAHNVTVGGKAYTFNVSGEGSLKMDKLTLTGNSLTVNGTSTNKASIGNIVSTAGTAVSLTNATVNITGGQSFKSSLTIGAGATVTVAQTDSMQYSGLTNTITLLEGGELAFGDKRWTVGSGTTLVMAGGTVSGAGDGSGALDYHQSGATIRAIENSTISASVKLRTGGQTTYFDIEPDKTLTMSGTLRGAGILDKKGAGTLEFTSKIGADFSGSIIVEEGTLNVANGLDGDFRNVTVNEGATVDLKGKDSVDYRMRYTLAGGTLTNTGNNTSTGKVQNDQITLAKDSTVSGTANFYILGGSHGATYLNLNSSTLHKTGTNTLGLISTRVNAGVLDVQGGTIDFNTANGDKLAQVAADIILDGGNISGKAKYTGDTTLTAKKGVSTGVVVDLNGHNLTLNVADTQTLTMTGAITGTGSLDKTGAGTATLSGANNIFLCRTIVVDGGTLNYSGSLSVAGGAASNFEVYGETVAADFDGTDEYAGSGFRTGNATKYYLVKVADGASVSGITDITGATRVTEGTPANSWVGTIDTAGDTTYYVNKNLTYNAEVMGSASGFSIAREATLTSAGVAAAQSAKVLHGEGTYIAPTISNNWQTTETGYGLGKNITLGSDWTGTVVVSGTSTKNTVDFARLANGTSSTIEVKGLDGWTNDWNGDIDENIKLTNNGNTVAWSNGATSGTQGHEAKFHGTWSGNGTFERKGSTYMDYKYTGDISQWIGKFQVSEGTTKLTFAGAAHEVNAQVVRTGGTLNVVVDTDVAFKAALNGINDFTVNAGRTATLTSTASLNANLAGAGTLNLDNANLTLDNANKYSGFTGTIVSNGASAKLVFNAAESFGGNLAQDNGGVIEMYGTAARVADSDSRIVVIKKTNQNLTLKEGSGQSIAKVTMVNGNSTWLLAQAIGENAKGLYTDIDLAATSGSQKGLIISTGNTTANIGSLSGVAGTEVRGDYDSGGNRVLVVHQDDNTTFAGTFVSCNNDRSVALTKYGTGTLTLTGANASDHALTVNEGTVAFSGSGKWVGATTVHTGGTLSLANDITTLFGNVTVQEGGKLTLTRMGDNAVNNADRTLTLNSGATVDLTSLGLTGVDTTPVILAKGGTIAEGGLGGVTVSLGSSAVRQGKLGVQDSNLMLTYQNADLIWDNNAGGNVWNTTSKNWHTAGHDDVHIAFMSGDSVTFNESATVSLAAATEAGRMTLAEGTTLNVTANANALTMQGITLGDGSSLVVKSTIDSRNTAALQVGLGDVSVSGTGSIDTLSSGWNVEYTITDIDGAAGSILQLGESNQVIPATVYNLTGNRDDDFKGKLKVSHNVSPSAARRIAVNIQGGAETLLQFSEVELSPYNNGHSNVGLGVNTNASVMGISSEVETAGHAVIFSGQASAQGTSDFASGSTAHTLTINTAGRDFTSGAKILAQINLLKDGEGTQRFTGDLSAMNGTVGVQAGTLALTNTGASAGTLASATVDGGALQLGRMNVSGAVAVNGGSLAFSDAASAASVSVAAGGSLMLGSGLTTTGNMTVGNGATLGLNASAPLTIGGSLELGDNITYNIGGVRHAGEYTVASAGGALTFGTPGSVNLNSSIYSGTLSQKDNNLVLDVTQTGKVLHMLLLTGQSNSLGAVKADPASAGMLAEYAPHTIQMWDGNMSGNVSDPSADTRNKAWQDEGKQWFTVQQQSTPTGKDAYGPAGTPYANLKGGADLVSNWGGPVVMGPEYGFSYMMEKQGWNMDALNTTSIIKVSRDGGANTFWDPANASSICPQIKDTVIKAILAADTGNYDAVNLDGLMFLQGESSSAGQGDNVKNVLTSMISWLQDELAREMQQGGRLEGVSDKLTVSIGDTVILGEPAGTGDGSQHSTAVYKQWAEQNPAQAGLVYAHDLTLISAGDNLKLHYDGNSQITIGARYAYAMAQVQGLDTTQGGTVRVRSQAYGDAMLGESSVALNDDAAWWKSSGDKTAYSAASLASTVAVWDVSSAHMANGERITGNLALGGIRIEDPYSDDENPGDHQATITINSTSTDHVLSLGSHGIELQQGDLTIGANVNATANQSWNTVYTPAGGAARTNHLAVTGTVTIGENVLLTFNEGSHIRFNSIVGTGSLSIENGVTLAMSQADLDIKGSEYSENENGYRTSDTVLIELTGASSTITATLDQLHFEDALAGQPIKLSDDRKSLLLDTTTSKTFHVRDSVVEYSAGHPEILEAKSISLHDMGSTGATLLLKQNLPGGDNPVTIVASGNGGTVNIDSGVSLNASAVDAASSALTIAGSGEYVGHAIGAVETFTTANVLGQGVSLAGNWTGKVVVSGGNPSYTASYTSLDPLADIASSLVLNGVYGYFSKDMSVSNDIEFRGTEEGGTGTALTYTAGNNKTLTLNGKISGSGDFFYNKNGGSVETVVMNGDIAEWTGNLRLGTQNTGGLNLTLGTGVTEAHFNITQDSGNKLRALTLTVNGTQEVVFMGSIGAAGAITKNGTGTLTLNAANTFSGGITVSAGTLKTTGTGTGIKSLGTGNVTINANGTLDVANNLRIDGLLTNSAGGTLRLEDGASLELYAGSGNRTYNIGKVALNGSATIMHRWNGATLNVASILGGASDTLVLKTNQSASGSTWNIGTASGAADNFKGTLVLQVADSDADNNRTATYNFKDGGMFSSATLELQDGPYKTTRTTGTGMTNNIVLADSEVKFGGINDLPMEGGHTRPITWTVKSNSNTDARTLVLDAETGSYTTKAGIDARVNIQKTGASEQTFTGSTANFNGDIDVEAGVLNIMNAASVAVQDVTIGANGTLGVYNGTEATPGTTNEGTLTIANTKTLTAGGAGATLNSNLELATGSTLDVSATGGTGLHLGSTLTINPGMKLSDNDMRGVWDLEIGQTYNLVYGKQFEKLFIKDSTGSVTGTYNPGELTAADKLDAHTFYNDLQENHYYVVFTNNGGNVGTYAIYCNVPEPTTGTLSLLALAALAARRRRK